MVLRGQGVHRADPVVVVASGEVAAVADFGECIVAIEEVGWSTVLVAAYMKVAKPVEVDTVD
jgi:hypothetical protein